MAAVAGLVLVIFGIGVAVLGAFGFTQGAEIGRFIVNNEIGLFGNPVSRDTMRSVLSVTPAALVVSGLLMLIAGAGVFAHKSWARWLGILLALVGLLVAIFAVSIAFALAGSSVALIVSVILLIGFAFALFGLLVGGSHFSARYPPAR